MGLLSDLNQSLIEAFDGELADAVKDFVLQQYLRGQYDPSTGSLTGTPYPVTFSSRGVFSSYAQVDIFNSNIDPTDVKLIVIQSELLTNPAIGDLIIRTEDSYRFRIVGIGQDPADVSWEIQIRGVE